MQAKDIMTTPVITVTPETTVAEIARTLFENRISAVPVVDADSRIIGMVSEGDLVRRPEIGTARHPGWWLDLFSTSPGRAQEYLKTHGLRAREIMTREVATVSEETQLAEVATLLERRRIKRVPVVRDGRPVGIVSRANLLHGLVARESMPPAGADDSTIRKEVQAAIKNTGVSPSYLNVVVSGGVVQLWGAVEIEAERAAIGLATERVPGVVRVDNRLGLMGRDVGWAYARGP